MQKSSQKSIKTITLEYDDNNIIAKKTLDYILSLGVFKVKEKKEPVLPKETLQAIKEMQSGDVVVCASMDDYKRKTRHA